MTIGQTNTPSLFVIGLVVFIVLWIMVDTLRERITLRNMGKETERVVPAQQQATQEAQALLALPSPSRTAQEERTPKVDVTLAARLLWETARPSHKRPLKSMTVTQDMEYVASTLRLRQGEHRRSAAVVETEETEQEEEDWNEDEEEDNDEDEQDTAIPPSGLERREQATPGKPVLIPQQSTVEIPSLHVLAATDQDEFINQMYSLFSLVEELEEYCHTDEFNRKDFSLSAEEARLLGQRFFKKSEWDYCFRTVKPEGIFLETGMVTYTGDHFERTHLWDWDTLEEWLMSNKDRCSIARKV